MIKKSILLSSLLLILSFTMLFFAPANTYAAEDIEADPAGSSCEVSGSFFGLPTWYKYLDTERDSTGRCSPVLSSGDEESVNSSLLIGIAVLEAMIRLAGVIAVVMIFFAGFKFITSQGNPDAAAAARKTAINALIGLVIVVLATTLVSFVGTSLSPPEEETSSARSNLS